MNIKRNVAWNLAEAVLTALMVFVLYKIIVASLGVEALGIWALVLAATSIGRFGDLGVAGGLGRYVATLVADKADGREVRRYIDTAVLLNGILYGVLAVALYWPAHWALGLTLKGTVLVEARTLLPYAIAAFALQNIVSVITAALVGFHLSYQKSVITVATLVVQAVVSVLLIDRLGLRGVAIGQLVQYGLSAAVAWALVVRAADDRWSLSPPHRLSRRALKDLVAFGVRLQALNMSAFIFDPLVKFVFAALGGVAALGLYELAQRGMLQVRQVLLAPSQNLTPLMAAAHRNGDGAMRNIYERSLGVLMLAGTGAMTAMAVGSPILSLIWLGRIEPLFVIYSCIIAGGWLCNILSVPAWHLGIATGQLRGNIAGSVVASLGALIITWLLGSMIADMGVVIGATVSIGAGGLVTWRMNSSALGLPFFPGEITWRALADKADAATERLQRR